MGALYFIILLGVLIFVHEFGHFICAKVFRVKVLKFSLGFGPRLVGFRWGETEYRVSAVPLGGYVKLLGEGAEGGDGVPSEVPEDERARAPADAGRALLDKPLWQRTIIYLGGPAMNLVFPVLIYFAVLLGRDTIAPASVGTVFAGTPAARAGLRPGDVIVAVGGERTYGFDDVVDIVEDSAGEPLEFRIRRGDDEFVRTITPARATSVIPILGVVDEVGRIGVSPYYSASILGPPGAEAERLGLRAFDEIVSVSGRRVRRLIDLERARVPADGRLDVRLLRGNPVPTGLGTVFLAAAERLELQAERDGSVAAALHAARSDLVVSRVRPGEAAAAGGLRPGDRLLRLDGKPLATWGDVRLAPETDKAGPHEFAVERDGRETKLTVDVRAETYRDLLGQELQRYSLGFSGYQRSRQDDPVPNPNRVSRALHDSLAEAWNVIRLTGLGIAAIFQGRVSFETIGGPGLIYEVAAQSGEAGAVPFLWAMALISINLGLLNLLPIPVLDGGQIVMFGIEAVRRRPLGRRTKEIAQTVGLVLILMLVALAIRNDIARWWTEITGFFGCG
jgi:regulator of sigma E protease